MKPLYIIMLLIAFTIKTNAQQLNLSDIPQMVELVDEHLKLNDYQKKELTSIFTESYQELVRVQGLNKTDIEKLKYLSLNQENTRSKLEVVLDHSQFTAYKKLLDGGNDQITNPIEVNNIETEILPNQSNPSSTVNLDGSAASIADRLNISGNAKSQFIQAYNLQEQDIEKAKQNGLNVESGIDLLTSILATDFKIIDLAGRSTYEEYFNLRQSGALNSDGVSSGQEVDITQVYQLYDLKQLLELSDTQVKDFLKMIIEGEAKKKMIRKQYQGDQRARKLKEHEQEGLQKLQQLLTPAQLQKLGQMMGG